MEVLQRCNGLNVTLKTAVEIKIDRAEWKPWHEETEMWLWKYQLWNCEGSNTGVQKGSRMGLTNTCPLPQTDAHRMAESLLHLGCSTLFFHLSCQFIMLPDTINSAAPAESSYPVWLPVVWFRNILNLKRPLLRGTYFIQLSLHLWVKKRWERRRAGCCRDQFSPHAKRIIQKMWEGGGATSCKGWSSKTLIIKHCALLQKPIKL